MPEEVVYEITRILYKAAESREFALIITWVGELR